MRKVVLTMFTSLDGFIAGPGGEFVPPDWSADMQRYWSDANVDAAGMLLYGRVNFEFNSGFWQSVEADANSPEDMRTFARRMNALPKLVFSDTLKSPSWNAEVVRGEEITDVIARKKQEPGKDLILLGGAQLAASFMKRDLIDEYRILVTPLLLGSGVPLFQEGYPRTKLTLESSRALDTGAVLLHYRRAA